MAHGGDDCPCKGSSLRLNLWSAALYGVLDRIVHLVEHEEGRGSSAAVGADSPAAHGRARGHAAHSAQSPAPAFRTRNYVSKTDEYGHTALHYAAQHGHADCVSYLLACGADANADGCGATALHRSSYAGHVDVVSLLIIHGADVNARDRSTGDMRTPIMKACDQGHASVVEALLNACDVQTDGAGPGAVSRGRGAHDGGDLFGDDLPSDVASEATGAQPSVRPTLDLSFVDRSGLNAADLAASCGHGGIVDLLRRHGCMRTHVIPTTASRSAASPLAQAEPRPPAKRSAMTPIDDPAPPSRCPSAALHLDPHSPDACTPALQPDVAIARPACSRCGVAAVVMSLHSACPSRRCLVCGPCKASIMVQAFAAAASRAGACRCSCDAKLGRRQG